MKRKTFLMAGVGVLATPIIGNKLSASAVSCAPMRVAAGTIATVKDGQWSDPATWGGRVPTASDTPDIKHMVMLNANASVAGLNIPGALLYAGAFTLTSTKNVIVTGALVMRPVSASEVHTLRFTGINESQFVGGGMDPLGNDTGLWIMGAGKLDAIGTEKTAWTNANSIQKGATQITVNAAAGWQPGDQYAITPTGTNETSFSTGTVQSASGSIVNITPTQYAHSGVDKWNPEVINLTRNVRIEGTEQGRAHVFIRSTTPQTIKHVGLRFMGPRKQQGGDTTTEMILGRYGLHFHHCMDVYGSMVEGCIIQDCNSHSFVPHVTNGITFRNNVAYNNKETAFWWDEGEKSHDVVYEGNLVARTDFVPRSLGLDTTSPTDPSFGCAGFMLGMGDDCVAKGNVVAGCNTGDPKNGGAYMWQANNEGVWGFENNTAHNCSNGVFIWQNSPLNHVLTNTDIYNCGVAIEHGAYANSYTFRGGSIYGCPFHVEASSQDSARVRLENIAFNGAGVVDYSIVVFSSPIPGAYPIFIRGCSFTGHKIAGVVDAAANELKSIDLIQCTATGTLVQNRGTAKEVVRVQPPSGQPYRVLNTGLPNTSISPFAPTIWGTGTGLKAEYFPNTTLTSAVVTRVDSNIAFQQWSTSLHHKLAMNSHSMRWSGKVQAQFTSAYTFLVAANGGVRLWVNGVQIINKWQDQRDAQLTSSALNLEAGKMYDIRLEYFNTDSLSGILLLWQCAGLPQELIPQSQLFPGDVVIVVPPPVTPPPTATITLTATPNPTRSNWAIRAVSSIGGRIKLTVTNSSGVLQASAEVQSGDTTNYGSQLRIGNYYLTAQQGDIIKTIQVIRQ